ncbi:Homeobox-leucine zipper protein ATHB-12-like protein [Drosera capensis]
MMRELSSSEEEPEAEPLSSEDQQAVSSSKRRKSKKKRRFNDEQVRSLETIFESETKLDPRKKVQVARDLGLQPRQVAIWFQNKRARWKSKEIEKNHRALKASYDCLKAKFDATKKEKESLLLQYIFIHAEKMKDLVPKQNRHRSSSVVIKLQELQHQLQQIQESEGSEDSAADRSEQNIGGLVLEPTRLEEELECGGGIQCSDDALNEHMHSSLTSQGKWCSLDPGNLFDQPSSVSHWWDSWA